MQYLISLWPMLQPILAGQLRHFLTLLAGALIAKGALQSDQSGAFVEIGIGLAGWAAAAVWSWWQKEGQARLLAALAKIHGGAPQSVSAGAAAKAAIDVATVVKILLIAFALSFLVMDGSAQAETKLKLPIDPLHLNGPTVGPSGTPSKPGACDITLFTNLTVANVITEIQNCVGSVVSAGATPFVTDIKAALDSATAAKDGTAIACLTPALAIATAAVGTPAVPAVVTNGVVTTPELPAVYPGPILIFQKYREFVTAGGPSNCKTAVQSTVNGTMAGAL
jgi:hypothetical protein